MIRGRVGLLALLAACASPGMPPGGPPDDDVPVITRISPDSNAVNVTANAVLIHFGEVIAERPSGAGGGGGAFGGSAAGLSTVVSISPSDGREEVNWRRTAIEIKPRRGFRENTAYRVNIRPGIADLRGNVLTTATEFVFSTGATIPSGEVRGVVFDFAQASPAPQARVEAFPPSDSTLRWTARADSSGRYVIRDLTPGTYLVRAWIDANSDQRLGANEAMDTATVSFEQSSSAELYAFVRDTMAPRIERVTVSDSTVLTLRFDRVVVGNWDPAGAVMLLAADSSAIAFEGTMLPAFRFDSLGRAASADTVPADSSVSLDSLGALQARADSVAADSAAAAAAAPVSDSTVQAAPPPRFERTRPALEWKVRLAAPLAPGDYLIRITGAPGLNGLSWPSERTLRVREPEPAPEAPPTTPPDSLRR